MSKKRKQKTDAAVEVAVIEVATPPHNAIQGGETLASVEAEIEADLPKARSVVKSAYKYKYRDRANEAGISRKAARRSSWDWLAQTLAGECLRGKDRIDIDRFLAILDANGVDHSRWQNRSKGWEGRLRMTGRLALQRVVAEAGHLKTPDGEELVAPAEWVAKHKS